MLEPVGRPSSTKSVRRHAPAGAHACDPRAHDRRRCKSLKARLAGPLRPLLDSAFVQRIRALGRRLAAAGTASYPPDVRRRLKILNVICYLIATTNFLYAIQQATTDFATYAPMVYMNLALVATVLLVPFAHRVNEIAGGVLLVVVEYAALVGFADFFSREGGAHLQYFIAAAAAVRHLRTAAHVARRQLSSCSASVCICMSGSRFRPRARSLRTNRRSSIRSIRRARSPPSC